MNQFEFKFWLTKFMIRPEFSFEEAQDIDGEVVATLVRDVTEAELGSLNAWDSNREGIWKLPNSWKEFYIRTYMDSDFFNMLETEYGEGKVLDANTFFDVKLVFELDGHIQIEAANFAEAVEKLPNRVIDDIFDVIDQQEDELLYKVFNSGNILSFNFSPTSDRDSYYSYSDL